MGTLDGRTNTPDADYRLMAVIMLDGHGKPEQLVKEYRKALERMLWNEFGELAVMTVLKITDDEVILTDSSNGNEAITSSEE